MKPIAGYPTGLDTTSSADQVFGHGGVRIYKVTRQLAESIHKEFRKKFVYDLASDADGVRWFYMNVNHGEQHFIFSLPSV